MPEQTWEDWLAAQRAASTMQVIPTALAEVEGWGMQFDGTRFGRDDGRFWSLCGFAISVPKEGQREVSRWEQPLIEEKGEGVVVVAFANDTENVLLAARCEPGFKPARNKGSCGMLTPNALPLPRRFTSTDSMGLSPFLPRRCGLNGGTGFPVSWEAFSSRLFKVKVVLKPRVSAICF